MLRSLLASVAALPLLVLACGGSVATVDDGRNPTPGSPGPSSTSTSSPTTPGTSYPGMPGPTPTSTPTHTTPTSIPPILALGYNQTCNGDTDCVVVTEQTGCSTCTCPSASINAVDLPKWQNALASHAALCNSQGDDPPPCGIKCAAGRAYCDVALDALVGQCRFAVQ